MQAKTLTPWQAPVAIENPFLHFDSQSLMGDRFDIRLDGEDSKAQNK